MLAQFLSEVLYSPKNCARDALGENGQILSRPKERVSDKESGHVAILFRSFVQVASLKSPRDFSLQRERDSVLIRKLRDTAKVPKIKPGIKDNT